MSRPPFPPFDIESATRKVRLAEDAWNSQNPEQVAQAYTVDSQWRNRTEFIHGRDEIVDFLKRKWNAEHEYRLIKELWGFRNNRMAVRFAYECHNDAGQWFRSYGNEVWEFDTDGSCSAGLHPSMICLSKQKNGCSIGPKGADRMIIRDFLT